MADIGRVVRPRKFARCADLRFRFGLGWKAEAVENCEGIAESKEGIIYTKFSLSGKQNAEGSSEESVSSASPSEVLLLRRTWPIFPIAYFRNRRRDAPAAAFSVTPWRHAPISTLQSLRATR